VRGWAIGKGQEAMGKGQEAIGNWQWARGKLHVVFQG